MLAPARAATVLVVEDDPVLRELYRDTLVASRYRVKLAEDGLTALAIIDTEQPDVVVLDLGLPRVSGWDVYHDLRSRPATASLPIIIVTGSDIDGIDLRDVASFMRKPVDPFRLAGAVDAALNRSI